MATFCCLLFVPKFPAGLDLYHYYHRLRIRGGEHPFSEHRNLTIMIFGHTEMFNPHLDFQDPHFYPSFPQHTFKVRSSILWTHIIPPPENYHHSAKFNLFLFVVWEGLRTFGNRFKVWDSLLNASNMFQRPGLRRNKCNVWCLSVGRRSPNFQKCALEVWVQIAQL